MGTRTKGYFLAARHFKIIPRQFDLYLAVQSLPNLPDLEGYGVKPDILVKQDLHFSDGHDAVIARALDYLAVR